jgi:hypothetical protein
MFYVPGVSGFASALYFALITMEVILATLLFFECRRRRVRLPFAMALGFFIAMHILMTPVATSSAFSKFDSLPDEFLRTNHDSAAQMRVCHQEY